MTLNLNHYSVYTSVCIYLDRYTWIHTARHGEDNLMFF